MEELNIKIKEEKNQRYSIFIDGVYFRSCWGLSDLEQFINSIIKSKFRKEYEGNI